MYHNKLLYIFGIYCLLLLTTYKHYADALPFDKYSSSEDQFNEISEESERKPFAFLNQLFNSAEPAAEPEPATEPEPSPPSTVNVITKDAPSESSKHATNMVRSVLHLISNFMSFGRTMIE